VNSATLGWKGADLTVERYLGRVGINKDNEMVKKHIQDAGITVVGFEEYSRIHKRFKSLKLTVKQSQLKQLENPQLWPEGVILCNSFYPRLWKIPDMRKEIASLGSANGNNEVVL
jgi:hypothetical protein